MLACSIAFILGGIFTLKTTPAKAQNPTEVKVEEFLPLSSIEQLSLSSPLDVYYDEEVTAILSDDTTTKTLTVYKDGEYKVKDLSSAQSLKKIDRIGDYFVLFVFNNLYLLPINEFETADLFARPITFEGANVGCNSFDVSGEYLSVVSGQNVLVYRVQDTYVTRLNTTDIQIGITDAPITSNSYGLYYVELNTLYFRAYDALENRVLVRENVNSSILLSNDNYIYYVVGNGIYRLDLSTKEEVLLEYQKVTKETYNLGVLNTISNISFKGDNLLVTDTQRNAIEEYNVLDDKLLFTGFAIASEKTAYNRISKDNLKVEYNGEKVAVLDKNKITVILDDANDYTPDNFINFKFDELGITPLTDICLGEKTILGFNDKTLYAFDLTTKESLGVILTSSFDIDDVSYRSGKYYVLSNDENAPKPSFVDEINENNLNSVNRIITLNGLSFNKIELDLLGNFYFTDSANLYTFNPNLDDTARVVTALNGLVPTKISTDLSGKLFLASSNELYILSNSTFNKIELGVNVLDFAISFSKQEVFFIDGNSEKLYITDDLVNSSIETLTLPENYTISDSTTTLDKLVFVSVREGANVFGYRIDGENIAFNALIGVESEYLVISEIIDQNSSEKFFALAGENQTVLVNQKDANQISKTVLPSLSKVYVTTPVHAYYLPKITKTDDYVARLNGEKIYIPLGSEIYPEGEVSFNGTAFYFAKISLGESEHLLYVPKSFTTDKIESAIEINTFTLRKLRPTTIYLDKNLTSPIITTTEEINVRLYSSLDGIIEIEYFNGETWVKGYALEKDLLNEPNTAIRNILIVLAVITCACGSITFFIVRNKQKN